MSKEEIFETTIMNNINRKSVFVDNVELLDRTPLFLWIDINVTELCNRTCVFCPRVDPKEYPNQNLQMSITLAKKIADELNEINYKGGVVFSGYSEPLLNPDIQSIIRQFGKKIHTEVVTNGDPLNEKMVSGLYDSGLDMMIVSLYDGPHQIEQFKDLFSAVGIGEEKYMLRDRWYDVEEDYGVKLTNRSGTVKAGNQQTVDPMKPCYYTHYSMMVDWNGDVMLCVQDWNKKVKFGNLNSNSLLEVWQSHNIEKYRRMLGKGFRKLEPCERCNVNGTLHGYNHIELWEKYRHR